MATKYSGTQTEKNLEAAFAGESVCCSIHHHINQSRRRCHEIFEKNFQTQNVVYLDHDGFRDSVYLRRLVRKNNGRLILRNSKKEIKHIIDIYGRILN